MTSTLPPDPYAALGVPKDATSAAIKSAYRKLVLKCHPDKVTDPALKQQKQEEFHKIQEAYECIADEDKRSKYDAEVRLEQLRKEKAARGGSEPRTTHTRYDTRTAAPAGAGPRYEERKPSSRSYDDDRFYDDRSRKYDTKYDTYDPFPPKTSSSSRSYRAADKETARSSKSSSDRTRSDHKKNRDKEFTRSRYDKNFPGGDESSTDEKMRYEQDFRRRSDENREAEKLEQERRRYEEARKKADTRRSYEESKEPRRQRSDERGEFDRHHKMKDQKSDAERYIGASRSKLEHDRPSPSRTSSSREIPRDTYERSSRRDRTDPRRSSAPRREAGRGPQIVDWEDDDEDRRSRPSLSKATSSPAEIHIPSRMVPQRSYTDSTHRRSSEAPSAPGLRRYETMPVHSSSSRRNEDFVPPRPSNLRSSESATPSFASIPPPSSTKTTKYYYDPSNPAGVTPVSDVKVANGLHTVTREPERYHNRSPSPLRPGISRPPMGPNRPKEPIYTTTTAAPAPRVSLNRAATINMADTERGRTRLFNEIDPKHARRPEFHRTSSYSPDNITFAPRYTANDVQYASRRPISPERYKPVSRHPASVGVH